MPPRVNLLDGVSTETKQDTIITALNDLLTELQQKLESGGTVALDATTLTALESITASVSNFPIDYPDADVLAKNEQIRALLASIDTTLSGGVAVTGTVAVSNHPTTIEVSNQPSDFPDSTAQATLATLPTAPFISGDGDGVGAGGNSGTATLGPADIWVGAWEDVSAYAAISITGKATGSSASNGAIAQFSRDGVNVLKQTAVSVLGTSLGGQPVSFALHPEARYFRIHYTNGGSSSDLELSTIYRKTPNTPGVLPIASTVTPWNLSQLVRAVLTAQRADGTYTSVTQDTDGNLDVNIGAVEVEVPISSLSAGKTSQQTIGTSAVQVSITPLANRRSVSFKSLSSNTDTIYIGFISGVTSGSGWPLDAGESMDLELDDTASFYAIAGAADQRLAILELS